MGGKVANDKAFMKKMMRKPKISELARRFDDRVYVEKNKNKCSYEKKQTDNNK